MSERDSRRYRDQPRSEGRRKSATTTTSAAAAAIGRTRSGEDDRLRSPGGSGRASGGIGERLVGGSGRTAADGGSVDAKRRGRSSLERDRVCELGSAAPVPLSPFLFHPVLSPLRRSVSLSIVPLLPLRLPLSCIHRRTTWKRRKTTRAARRSTVKKTCGRRRPVVTRVCRAATDG